MFIADKKCQKGSDVKKNKTHPMVIPFHGISWAQKHIYPYIWPWIDGHTKNMAIWLYGYIYMYVYIYIYM